MPAVSFRTIDIVNSLASEIADISTEKGFWEDQFGYYGIIPVKLALVASEVSEALDVHRKDYGFPTNNGMHEDQREDFTEELADVIIRVLDICGFYDLDIGRSIVDKVEKNRDRPFKHSKRY